MNTENQSPVDDLFGDEDLRIEPQPREIPPRRQFTANQGLVVGGGLMVLLLLWWWSSAHHNQFYLVVSDGQVSVERGYYFPFGQGEWAPNRAYESFTIPKTMKRIKTGSMSERELDKTLKSLFINISKIELSNLASGKTDVAEDMLLRAQKLRSTSVADDRVILKMLGDVAFRRGLTEVRGIQSRFDEALAQFQLAHSRGGSVYTGAQKWVTAISRLRLEFRRLSLESGIDPDLVLRATKSSKKTEKAKPLPKTKKGKTNPKPKTGKVTPKQKRPETMKPTSKPK